MNEEQRIKLMEEELKILKNEVKTILLDIREQYLNIQNPFNFNMVANTPPAGASPEQKEKRREIPPDEIDLAGDTALASADTDMADAVLSFDKPFADLSGQPDIETPGMAPAGFMNEDPGPGLSTGPGPSVEMPGLGDMASEDEAEDEQPQKNKKLRGKKKGGVAIEEELDSEEEEIEEQDILINTRAFLPKNGKKKGTATLIRGTRSDLVVIAGLTQWVDQATGKLGKDRTEALVEMSNAMGRIPDNIKDVLIRMVRISRYESNSTQSPTATDYLATLAQLESLMSGEQIQDNALLSVLSMMKESTHG
ncbi:MAG: hypothetical protein JXA01_09360 [Dehalococcoidia bacterium]|nr:hypothetical protein [Dehalococcoidia bacterium]